MDDAEIIRLLWERAEAALTGLSEKYGRLVFKLSENILGNREDAAECVNDTWLGVWNAIPPQRPQVLCAFVCRIGRNISLKRYRSNTAAKRNHAYEQAIDELEDCLISPSAEEIWSAGELGRTIDRFLDTLDRKNRLIFMRRYWFSDSITVIASRMGMSENNISVRLSRIRSRLRDYLLKEEMSL